VYEDTMTVARNMFTGKENPYYGQDFATFPLWVYPWQSMQDGYAVESNNVEWSVSSSNVSFTAFGLSTPTTLFRNLGFHIYAVAFRWNTLSSG
jgi:hypothetical protein